MDSSRHPQVANHIIISLLAKKNYQCSSLMVYYLGMKSHLCKVPEPSDSSLNALHYDLLICSVPIGGDGGEGVGYSYGRQK